MKKSYFIILLLILLLGYSSAKAIEFWPEISGDAVWGNGADTLNPNERFYIDMYFNNDYVLFSLSTPFILYGTGDVTNLTYQEFIFDPDFMAMCWPNPDNLTWDWDGILPDEFGIYGMSLSGFPQYVDIRYFRLELEILGDETTEGTFCIDSGDADDDTYDWLFDPPVPFGGPYCWEVKQYTTPPGEMQMWSVLSGEAVYGDSEDTIDVNEQFFIDIYYHNTDAPRTLWSSPFRFSGTENVSILAFYDFYAGYYFFDMFDEPYPGGYSDNWDDLLDNQLCVFGTGAFPGDTIDYLAIRFIFEIEGDETTEGDFCVEKGDFDNDNFDWIFESPVPDFTKTCWAVKQQPPPPFICGDFNTDGNVNILDVTFLVMYLYLGGPEPYHIRSADVNHSCNVNILDVTYLIGYLYMSGPVPNCPAEWPCTKSGEIQQFKRIELMK